MTNRIRKAAAALIFLCGLVTLASAFNLQNRSPGLPPRLASVSTDAKPRPHRTALTFVERVAYQRAIEEVYWRQRIWPKERADSKPPLDEVMSRAHLEKKVKDYLRASQALEDYWQRPLTAEQLQAEMDRMAQHTKQPEVLRELFEALGNDPFVIAECLARPALSERLVTNFYAHDQRFHGELKKRAEADLREHRTVRQMKQTSGKYSEIELVRSDSAQEKDDRGIEPGVKVESDEWDENVQKLAAIFDGSKNGTVRTLGAPTTQMKTGVLSPLQEDQQRYYATAVIKKTKDRLKLATVEWRKEPFDSWKAAVETQLPKIMVAASADYVLPTISGAAGGCSNNTWARTSLNSPFGRELHTAVWTGSEMVVWGGQDGVFIFGTGGRYNPSTDAWTTTSTTNAPSPRAYHTAVWTGTQMIIWGGYNGSGSVNTGGRYNPATNSWTATSTTSAPAARSAHTAIWTGTEMIVWGGAFGNFAGYLNTGGRYNPSTNTWATISTTNAPTARSAQTAVWTGSEMIVWGGFDFYNSIYFNTGGRYNPSTNTWTAASTTNAPSGRYLHTAVWTGKEMIVWGGEDTIGSLNTGGRYNPSTNSWAATSMTNAPARREEHTAVWTGNEMIVWGGLGDTTGQLNSGARYNPAINSWTATSITNAPHVRFRHAAIWTGTEMIVWGGRQDTGISSTEFTGTGGKYNPTTNTWTTTNGNAPSARDSHSAAWTGAEMIIWGGYDGGYAASGYTNTGARYNPATDSWTPTSTINAPSGRDYHTTVWTGTEVIVWGGFDSFNGLNTGGRYNPGTNSWIATSTTKAPTGRSYHTAVWTGSEMIVWGGHDANGKQFNTGGRYNPSTNTWTATSTSSAPTARSVQTAVWTGSEMLVWGGADQLPDGTWGPHFFNTGGKYNPNTNTWTAITITNAPTGRLNHTAVWTGSEMIIWGGSDGSNILNTGGRYNPSMNSWRATTSINALSGRAAHTAIWTGHEMIVWGGGSSSPPYWLSTGGRYDPATEIWTATSTTNGPYPGRSVHTAIWTGSEMIVWGGDGPGRLLETGGRYCAQFSVTGPPAVATSPATYIASYSTTLNGWLNPHGLAASVYFQYGTTTSYGFSTPVQSQTGSTYRSIGANITGLAASTTYHFRIVATNSAGTKYGSDRTFTTLSATGPPVVITSPATNVASSSATLNGSVDPHGLTTTVYFQYGTTTSYGHTTASQSKTGNTYQNVAANISGLAASTTYHFRIVATNSAGTVYGSDRTFTTL